MKGFAGFPEGPVRMTPLPATFFTDLLPSIDHLGELKLILYVLWRFSQQEGARRYLALSELREDSELLSTLKEAGRGGEEVLSDALERSVARGTLLAVRSAGKDDAWYFLNSPRGKAAAEGLARGDWKPDDAPSHPRQVERPNIFTLYEQNIGMLTPMVAEILRDAEKEYPAGWIEEAVRIAVEHNARSWKYIAAILARWKKEGRGEKKTSPEDERRRYIEGEYADFIEH
ncbi:MAG: DnaD domain protein [Anaerolineales bacterium]|nr:DnaD domain protein [Anaerolineales bacterium]